MSARVDLEALRERLQHYAFVTRDSDPNYAETVIAELRELRSLRDRVESAPVFVSYCNGFNDPAIAVPQRLVGKRVALVEVE